MGNLDILGHIHLYHNIILKKPLIFICKNFILYIFLKILQRYCKLIILGALEMPGFAHLRKIVSTFVRTFTELLYLTREKSTFSSIFSWRYCKDMYINFLFWVLWVCMATQTQNDSINLSKTLTSICMPKINFIIHFFFGILHFKESCSLIGQQHFDP